MTGIIILAAGESSRLGAPKQNLVYKDKTLLQHAVDAATRSACRHVIVVLGANAEIIIPTIEKKPIQIIHNQNWQEGIASSIRIGINALQDIEMIENAIIILCDQPFTDTILINKLIIKHHASHAGVVACTYNNTTGVPMLFNKKYFPDLISLQGQEGARKIFIRHMDDSSSIEFPLGSVDIDTKEDYDRLFY